MYRSAQQVFLVYVHKENIVQRRNTRLWPSVLCCACENTQNVKNVLLGVHRSCSFQKVFCFWFFFKCSNVLSGFAATLAALTVFTLILSLKGQLRSQPLLCQVQHKKRQTGISMKCNSIGWPLAGKTGVRQCFKDLGFRSNICERGYSPMCCSFFWPGWWWKLRRRHQTLSSKLMLLGASMPDENQCKF